jgi:CO dehydrogenase maturation factor
MPIKIAVSGKGGVGKTTITAMLARLYARQGSDVLAIDADPATSLDSALGVPKKVRASIAPLSGMLDLVEERTGARPGSSYGGTFILNPKVDDIVERYGVPAPDGVVLLVLGTIETPGSGCYCPQSSLLKALMSYVLSGEGIVIMDMEAGLEHLGRSTARNVDVMLIVVEPGMRSVDTASTIARMAKEIGVGNVFVVLNKCSSNDEEALVSKELMKHELELIATIPNSAIVKGADLHGVSPMDLPGVETLLPLLQSIKDRIDST